MLLVAVAAVAVGGSLATIGNVEGWYADARKAPWSPPDGVFGPVWSALYFGIAVACFLIWRRGHRGADEPNAARDWIRMWVVQLVLNALWTPAFFGGFPVIGEPAWWIAAAIILTLLGVVVWLVRRVADLAHRDRDHDRLRAVARVRHDAERGGHRAELSAFTHDRVPDAVIPADPASLGAARGAEARRRAPRRRTATGRGSRRRPRTRRRAPPRWPSGWGRRAPRAAT